MPLSVETIAWSGGIVTLAYVVYGITGFGASIVAIPLLAHFFPLRFAVPMMVIFDLLAGLLTGLRNRSRIDTSELRSLVPFMLLGVGLGATVLVKVPDRWLLISLGVFLILYPAWSLLSPPKGVPLARQWARPFGTLGGMFAATFGTGGPIFALYLAGRLPQKDALRATLSSMVTLAGMARLVVFATAGLYVQQGVLLLAAWLLPCAFLGLFIGSSLHRTLPTRNIVRTIWILLLLSGASLLRRGLGLS